MPMLQNHLNHSYRQCNPQTDHQNPQCQNCCPQINDENHQDYDHCSCVIAYASEQLDCYPCANMVSSLYPHNQHHKMVIMMLSQL